MTSAFITLSSGARGDEVFNFLFFLVTLPRDLVLRRVLVDGDGECLDSKDWLLGSKGLERAFSDSKGVKVCCFEGWLGSEDSLLDSNDWRLDSEGERPDEDFLFTFVFFTSHPYVLTHLREQNLLDLPIMRPDAPQTSQVAPSVSGFTLPDPCCVPALRWVLTGFWVPTGSWVPTGRLLRRRDERVGLFLEIFPFFMLFRRKAPPQLLEQNLPFP
mmetsp:Transcript_23873/g.37531  ORF Transcript_23873/g.37531 Transcript_23873/m.37531 type:complete len:215 (-) Transcript_23873:23-667(-)